MKLDRDRDVLQTFMGSTCTILIAIITILYAYQKTDVWLGKKDVDIMSSVIESHFNDSYVFSHANGLNVAVAFTAYDSEREPILDKSIG